MNYRKIYNQLIERIKLEGRVLKEGIYYEVHHVKPKCLGGTGKFHEWKTHPNLVLVAPKEHFFCHLLLHKIYPNNKKILNAFWKMCVGGNKDQPRYIPSSKLYEETKLKVVEARKGEKRSKEAIDRRTQTRFARGNYRRTEESIRKGIETKKQRGNLSYGPLSLEHRKKLSLAKEKPILDNCTGVSYRSMKELKDLIGVSYSYIYTRLKNGKFKRI